jgi:hypothetical protein
MSLTKMSKVFPYRMQIRQRIDYLDSIKQLTPPLRPGRVDQIISGDKEWFLRFLCPCMEASLDVILNTRFQSQNPYYNFLIEENGYLTVSERIQTICGCQYWIKQGEIIDYQKIEVSPVKEGIKNESV